MVLAWGGGGGRGGESVAVDMVSQDVLLVLKNYEIDNSVELSNIFIIQK